MTRGGVMSVSEDKTATLRAQEHGHQPILCLNRGGIRYGASKETESTEQIPPDATEEDGEQM